MPDSLCHFSIGFSTCTLAKYPAYLHSGWLTLHKWVRQPSLSPLCWNALLQPTGSELHSSSEITVFFWQKIHWKVWLKISMQFWIIWRRCKPQIILSNYLWKKKIKWNKAFPQQRAICWKHITYVSAIKKEIMKEKFTYSFSQVLFQINLECKS